MSIKSLTIFHEGLLDCSDFPLRSTKGVTFGIFGRRYNPSWLRRVHGSFCENSNRKVGTESLNDDTCLSEGFAGSGGPRAGLSL